MSCTGDLIDLSSPRPLSTYPIEVGRGTDDDIDFTFQTVTQLPQNTGVFSLIDDTVIPYVPQHASRYVLLELFVNRSENYLHGCCKAEKPYQALTMICSTNTSGPGIHTSVPQLQMKGITSPQKVEGTGKCTTLSPAKQILASPSTTQTGLQQQETSRSAGRGASFAPVHPHEDSSCATPTYDSLLKENADLKNEIRKLTTSRTAVSRELGEQKSALFKVKCFLGMRICLQVSIIWMSPVMLLRIILSAPDKHSIATWISADRHLEPSMYKATGLRGCCNVYH